MKLRNKKTGEIIEDAQYRNYSTADGFGIHTPTDEYFYNSLKEFFEDWEDYTYQEPLIKDEKIRKAVRAFSEAIQEKKHILVIKQCGLGMAEFSNGSRFWIRLPLSNETMDALEDRTYYTIIELCGEEECES